MAVVMCETCDNLVDLDWNVEGEWDDNGDYHCETCLEKEDEPQIVDTTARDKFVARMEKEHGS